MLKPSVLVVCLAVISATAADLRRIDLPTYHAAQEVTFDLGDLINRGQVQPRSAITIDRKTSNGWLLRTEKADADLRWYRPLLNAHGKASDSGALSRVGGRTWG